MNTSIGPSFQKSDESKFGLSYTFIKMFPRGRWDFFPTNFCRMLRSKHGLTLNKGISNYPQSIELTFLRAEIPSDTACEDCWLAPSKPWLLFYTSRWCSILPDLQQVFFFRGIFSPWAFHWLHDPSPFPPGMARPRANSVVGHASQMPVAQPPGSVQVWSAPALSLCSICFV